MPTKNTVLQSAGLTDAGIAQSVSRRKFFGYLGATSAILVTAASCKKDDTPDGNTDDGVDLGSGDVGVLNYAYALEQLEAAFYIKVVDSFYGNANDLEKGYLTDIRDHEVAHRNFFKAAITAAGATPLQDLEVDFSSIDFTSRDSVLGTAKAFEDLGVSAYNGAGKLITTGAYLTIAGKIVSVEARHAALIRDLISNGTFADNTVVDAMGLDMARTPAEVFAIAGTYVKTKISIKNLPTS
ncbi:MAG: ferritin-like domain-containing protein [Ginsengibacter sp.]